MEYWYHGKQKPEIRIERVKLWNGTFPCIIDWTDTVLRKQQDPDTQDSSIWVYDQHYNPLYIPKLEDIQKGASAATLGEINEGLPDPSTALKDDANKIAYQQRIIMSITAEAQTHMIEVLELPQDHPIMEMLAPEMEFSQSPEVSSEMHEHDEPLHETVELPEHLELVVDELPGVAGLDPDLEHALEVAEDTSKDKEKEDANDARKVKKITKWDWESKGAPGFIAWIKERLVDVPKHSGYDSAGLERAIAYMGKLDDEISRAMRLDLDGELDADKIEEVRAKIDDGIERLHVRLDKIKKKHSSKKRKKAEEQMELIKQAQKMPTVSGIVITVPLTISAICRTMINGMVSGGHSLEDQFEKLSKKWKLTEREQMECVYHLQDMGLTVRRDRGIMLDEEYDQTSSDNFDFGAGYQA